MPNWPKYFFALFCLFSSVAYAQTGNYFLSHYSPSEERFDYVCFEMIQDGNGVMYFATKAGILEFDGRDWDLLPLDAPVYSIKITEDGEIFWSGAKGYGKVSLDQHGFQHAEVLSDSTVSDVFQSIIFKDKIYFLSDESIYVYDTNAKKSATLSLTDPESAFMRIFQLYDVVYANTTDGVVKIVDEKVEHTSLNLTAEVVFYSRIDDTYVVGTADNKIYTCDQDLNFRAVQLQDQKYIEASVIVNGNWLNRQLLALGTLRGGVIFVNPINGKTQEIVNYSTGLPDNEVFAMMTDVTQNVWVAHEYGFTMVAPFMPMNSFNHYQGLSGNLLCAFSSQGTVYVGTSLGLFKLEKVDLYDELVYYVDVEVKEPKPSGKTKGNVPGKTEAPQQVQTQEEQAKESRKGGLFSFLRRNKNKESKEKETEPKKEEPTTSKSTDKQSKTQATSSSPAKPTYKRVKKTERILRASQYVYKKVEGIDAKINHLAEINGKLIASGLSGIYEVVNLTAKPILEEPIRFVFPIAEKNLLLASTYENQLRPISLGERQEKLNMFENVDDQIHYIFNGRENEIWLCGIENIYRAEFTDSVVNVSTVDALKRNSDKTIGVVWMGEILLVNAEGFFKFDRQHNDVISIDSLPMPLQHFAHGGSILYRDIHGWKVLGNQDEKNNLQLLNLFDNLRFIASDNDPSNLWLISGNNELYKFHSQKMTPYDNGFPLFLKSVVNQNRIIQNQQEIEMDQENSSVRFHVVQPDFINPHAVEYRYFLEGMQSGWTEWSTEHDLIDFPYLPNGEYTLHVQAKNIFGKITELTPVSFEVLPPYWKRSWFYAMEFAVLASLVILSFQLSTRYRIVSRLLSLLTIILLIQFIQTAIGATIVTEESPVIEFIIQVVVALLVLPVEGYLRNLMLRSLDSSGKFYQFIIPKSPPKINTKAPEQIVEEVDSSKNT